MATVPAMIIIRSNDSIHLPIKALLVVVKQLFQYGVKNIITKNDMVIVSLSYSPKGITLHKKFGNLPVTYLRTKLDTIDEVEIFEKVMKKYKFNYEGDAFELEDQNSKLPIKKNEQSSSMVVISDDDDDDDNDGGQKQKQKRKMEIEDGGDDYGPQQKKKRSVLMDDNRDEEFEILSQDFI